jgi:hypothetical protein
MNADLIISELQGSKIRRTEDGRFSVYDLIRIAGGQKNPRQVWKRLCEQYSEVVTKTDNFQFPGKAQRLTPVAISENALYILGLLPGICGQAYREKAANIVRRYIEGDADLGVEILIRDHNRDRVDRAKKRLLVCETNKQTAELAHAHNASYGKVHNDRYQGLYRQSAADLRKDAGLKPTETPLNALSTYDLTLNSLANQMAAMGGNPNAIYGIADNLRQVHNRTFGKSLTPTFETTQIRPSQAKSIAFGNDQLEMPTV